VCYSNLKASVVTVLNKHDGNPHKQGRIYVGSKNAVFWDVSTAVITKDVVFCDMTPCGSSKKGFGGTYRLQLQGYKTESSLLTARICLTTEALFPIRRVVHPRCELGRLNFVSLKMKAVLLLNVRSCKSHTASYPRRWHSS
jgi:hypothetical protein